MGGFPHSSVFRNTCSPHGFAVWLDWRIGKGREGKGSYCSWLAGWAFLLVRVWNGRLSTKLGMKWSWFSSYLLCELRHKIRLFIHVGYCVTFELWGIARMAVEQNFLSGAFTRTLGLMKHSYGPLCFREQGNWNSIWEVPPMLEKMHILFFNNLGHFSFWEFPSPSKK